MLNRKFTTDLDLIKEQGLTPIRSYLRKLGGWPVVEGEDWLEEKWSWQKVALALEKQGFPANQLFEIYIDSDMRNSSRRTIIVSTRRVH